MYYWFASKDKESGYARKALCNCRICANAETFPLRAERYPSASLCLVFDPAKASLTDAFVDAIATCFGPNSATGGQALLPPQTFQVIPYPNISLD